MYAVTKFSIAKDQVAGISITRVIRVWFQTHRYVCLSIRLYESVDRLLCYLLSQGILGFHDV